MPGIDAIGSLSSLAGSIISGLSAQNQQQWLHGLLASIFQEGGNANTLGRNQYSQFTNDFYPNLLSGLFGQQAGLFGTPDAPGRQYQVGNQIDAQNASLPALYSGINNWQGPNGAAAQGTQDLAGSLGGTQNLAQQVFAGGGWTPQGQQGFDQISRLLSSPLAGTSTASNMFGNLFGNGGATDFTSALQNAGRQSLSDGGMTPTLNAAGAPLAGILGANGDTANNDILRQFGLDALQTGGYTGNSAAGAASALQGVQSGGRTGTTDALQGRGLELLNREALLPLQQVLAMARDGAGAAGLNAAERARREAVNRGGGPGATVANGMTNQAFAEFADQIARNESDAATKALTGQQELQQREQLAGGSIAAQGADAERNRMAVAANLLAQLEQGSTQRYNVGGQLANAANDNETKRLLSALGLIPDIQNSATNVMGTVGGLGVQGGRLENDRLGIGSDLFKTMTGNELSQNSIGLNSLINLLGNQNQYALGAGTLANNSARTSGDLLSNLLQNSIQGGRLNLDGINAFVGAQNSGTKNNLDLLSLLSGNYFNTFQAGNNMMGPWLNYANNGMNTMSAPIGGSGAASQNPFASLAGFTPTRS